MANVAFHMAAGLGVGTVFTLAPVVRAWTSQGKLAKPIARLLVTATLCGFLAIVPNVLRWLELTPALYEGWWANVFVLHPLIDRMRGGGMLIGHVTIALFFISNYLLLLWAVLSRHHRATRRGDTPS